MRLRNLCVGVCALLLTTGLAVGQSGAPFAYASNTDGEQIFKITIPGGVKIPVVSVTDSSFEDLIVGPDLFLYVCDPINGTIDRIDPETSVLVNVFTSMAGDTLDLDQPQCGTFTHRGDLVVTDRGGGGVFIFPDLAMGEPVFDDPVTLLGTSAAGPLPTDFRGEGVTQAATGDLLIVDRSRGSVWQLLYNNLVGDFFDPTDPGALMEIITGLDEPIGIARSSFGHIFVATEDGVERFTATGGPVPAVADCTGLGRRDRPYFLEFTSDDTLYVATTSKKAGRFWELFVDKTTCEVTADGLIAEFRRPAEVPSLTGVAVPPTSLALTEIDIFPDRNFNFVDHLYELTAGLDGEDNSCTATITATETAPTLVKCLIDSVFDSDENDPGDEVDGFPVADLGGRGFEQVYEIVAADPVGLNCPPPADGLYRHAINQFTDFLGNPRIIACETLACDPDVPDPDNCNVITLTSYDPLSGIFEGDGRTGGTRGDFSSFFLADISLTGEATEAGCFCGFESPVGNVDEIDLDDPFFDPTSIPTFSIGGTVALKFKIAALGGAASCDAPGFLETACSSGPYVDFAQVLFSLGRIAEADGTPLDPYEPQDVRSAGGSGTEDPAVFGNPNNPNKPYHYNWATGAYQPGIYRVVLVFLTDNDRARIRYVRLVE